MTVPALCAEGVVVELGGRRVLDGVSLCAESGEFLCLTGPNGGGKTTFLKAALGLLPLTAGRMTLLGGPPAVTRPAVGYVPQRKGFAPDFPATVAELVVASKNAGWPLRLGARDRALAQGVLARVGGEALLDRPVAHLSGGELQRAFLARALAHEPRLLLLDEPTAGIDADGRADFLDLLAELGARDDLTIVLVTHSVATARRLADRVAYLAGTVRALGPPSEVLREGAEPERALLLTTARAFLAECEGD
jgi:ABC-type Mn2+/Zn2+ transport system ATPase subunit